MDDNKRFLLKESQFKVLLNEVAQSKKIKKYVTFSTVLDWYLNNKTKIAQTLNVPVENLASEREILEYSDDLIRSVINPQSGGREGFVDVERGIAFKAFNRLEGKLVHDILHFMYDASIKEFDKSESEFEFTESELIEEIEVLAVEETFMKYMNVDYVKSDFINQNINRLITFALGRIITQEPERIASFLDGEEEPYIEVYGKKYKTKGTPYEGIFTDLIHNAGQNVYDYPFEIGKIESGEDFRKYLVNISTQANIIDDTGGDRGQYDVHDWWAWVGEAPMYESQKWENHVQEFIDNPELIDYQKIVHEDDLINMYQDDLDTVSNEKLGEDYESGFDEDVTFVTFYEDDDNNGLEDSAANHLSNEEYDEFFNNFTGSYEDDLENNPKAVELGKKVFEKEKNNYVELIKRNILEEVVEEQGGYTVDEIFNSRDDYYFDDNGEIVTEDYFRDKVDDAAAYQYDGSFESLDEAAEYAGADTFRDDDLDQLVSNILSDDTARALLRRTIRTASIVRNNTDIGERDNNPEFLDLETEYNFPSLSKNLVTENSKRLWNLLNEFRGHVIKNFKEIKQDFKNNTKRAQELVSIINQLSSEIITSPENSEEIIEDDGYMTFSDKSSLLLKYTTNYPLM